MRQVSGSRDPVEKHVKDIRRKTERKFSAAREAIQAVGAQLRFLPPDSPDFNPIEMAFRNSIASSRKPQPEQGTISGRPSPKAWAYSLPLS